MGEALITRRGGGGGGGIDSIINGDMAIYATSFTNVRYNSGYDRAAINLKPVGSEKKGLVCWQSNGSFGNCVPVRAAEIDWEAQTVTLVVQPSGHTNKIYDYMFSSGTCYVAYQSYENEDGDWPVAVYIPEA